MVVVNFRGSFLDNFLSFWGIRRNTCWNFWSRIVDDTSFLWSRVDILIPIFGFLSSNNSPALDWPINSWFLCFTWKNLFICNLRSCSLSTTSIWSFNFITNNLLSSYFFFSYHITGRYINYSSISLYLLSFWYLLSFRFEPCLHGWWHLLSWSLSFLKIWIWWWR